MDHSPVPFFGLRFYYAGSEVCGPGHRWTGVRDHWLFHLVHAGRGQVTLPSGQRNLEKGQGFLVAPDTEVAYEADREAPWTYSWMACSGPEAATGFRASGLGPSSPWYDAGSHALSDLGGEFHSLALHMARQDDGFLQNAGLVAAFACLRRGLQPPPTWGPAAGDTLEAYAVLVDDLIRRSLSRPDARVEAWARQAGVSRKHLSEVVLSRRGASPRALLTQARLVRGAELLASTALSVAAVAASVGYTDPLAFSRAFRERFGLAPRAWRTLGGSVPS